MHTLNRLAFVLSLAFSAGVSLSAPASDPVVSKDLARIRATAISSDWAWQQLARLTDGVGPRLSGSPQLAAGIEQVAATMRKLGASVTLQPVKVPHWVRGEERAELTEYPGRPAGLSQSLHLTALGGSGATPVAGLNARVIVVRDFKELEQRASEVRGNIVLYTARFDQRLADHGHAMDAYGQAGVYRFEGPSRAASLGAAAALLRSVGPADYRLPHTGATVWAAKQSPIPAAALASEDVDLLERLSAKGRVQMHLLLRPQLLPDADSFNVIADWPGAQRPEEIVIVSGHLDSWDLGTGAIDDGVGVMAAAGVLAVMRDLNLHPKRTIRFIAWTNEENGGRGGDAYFQSVHDQVARHCAAIESDAGAGRSLGIAASMGSWPQEKLQPLMESLAPLGATLLELRRDSVGSDIGKLQRAGVAGFEPLVDTRHYFDYHHTAADTLDKVDPVNLKSQVATMAMLAYFLAQGECPTHPKN